MRVIIPLQADAVNVSEKAKKGIGCFAIIQLLRLKQPARFFQNTPAGFWLI